MEVALFIAVMAALYLILFSRYGLFARRIRARKERRRRMRQSRPGLDEPHDHVT